MKKIRNVLFLTVMFCGLLYTGAMAADTVTGFVEPEEGFTANEKVTVTPYTAGSKDTRKPAVEENGVYVNAAQLDVTYNNAKPGEYVIFVVKGDETVPTEGNIAYIYQYTVPENGNKAEFRVYPMADKLEDGATYHIRMTSNTDSTVNAKTDIGSFVYRSKSSSGNLGKGDVNGDGKINADDATMILQYAVNLIKEGSTGFYKDNCDVNNDGKTNADDATMVLQYAVNLITKFG